MSIPSELGHIAIETKRNQLARASFEPGNSRSSIRRSAVPLHWLAFGILRHGLNYLSIVDTRTFFRLSEVCVFVMTSRSLDMDMAEHSDGGADTFVPSTSVIRRT